MLTSLFLLGFMMTMQAQKATPVIKAHQVNQNERIRAGIKSGEISKAELRCIRKDKKKVRHLKHSAKADGVVSPKERAQLHKKQHKNSRKIYRAKHNAIKQ